MWKNTSIFVQKTDYWPSKIDLRWWQACWKSFLGETQIKKKQYQFKCLVFLKFWNNRKKPGLGTFRKTLFKKHSVYQSQSLLKVLWLIVSHQWNSKARPFLANGPHYLVNSGEKKTYLLLAFVPLSSTAKFKDKKRRGCKVPNNMWERCPKLWKTEAGYQAIQRQDAGEMQGYTISFWHAAGTGTGLPSYNPQRIWRRGW